jgi:RimJ/RimL family protein N-acetyltransferase
MPARLQTARLSLRPVAEHDEGPVLANLNDLAVSGWLAPPPYPYRSDDFYAFRTTIARPGVTFAIEDMTGFVGIMAGGNKLGYWFAPSAHGQGYATEAGEAVLSAEFSEGGGDVESGYFVGNHRSARVLEKLGFVETERDEVYCRPLGTMRPHVTMRLTFGAFSTRLKR